MEIITIKRIVLIIAITVFTVMALVEGAKEALAQEVKYCKNYQTGTIIVVEASYPCPYPTVEI